MTTAEKFKQLFAGHDGAYGVYRLTGTTSEKGKSGGEAFTKRSPVTVELWERHLAGEQGIGIVPIREDSSSMFGAIDVDSYKDFDLKPLARRVAGLKLPLVLCRSKSGGAHLYLFSRAPVTAQKMIDRLKEIANGLGFLGVEIFPKQAQFLGSRGDVGNWINMPYYDAAKTTRYALGPDGVSLDVEKFLDYADLLRVPREFFDKAVNIKVDPGDLFPDGPPCLQQLAQDGIPEGSRNNGLVNIALYCKRAYPNDWRAETRKRAEVMLQPNLPSDELNTTINSVAKGYLYTCAKEPIHAVCNREVCLGRKFGVGRANKEAGESSEMDNLPVFGELQKVTTDPPTFFWLVNGEKISLTTKQLLSPRLFQERCADLSAILPPTFTEAVWQKIVREAMANMVLVEAPDEGSIKGQFWEHVEAFCRARATSKVRADILKNKPVILDGKVWFKQANFAAFLEKNKFRIPLNQITAYLSERDSTEHKKWNVRGASVHVWGVPEPSKIEAEDAPAEEAAF